MKNEFFLNIHNMEALNGLFRLDFTHYKSEDGVGADLAVTFSREWSGRMREESMTVGSGILKDDRLVLKIQHDEIPFSIELDRIGIGRILNESSRRIQDFPDDKIQTFTTQYLDVTNFYRDYMKDKAEKVASSPIDELYITYDNNRRYMTARVGDIWLPEKDVTFGMAALSHVPEDKAYDYQRYEKAEEYYQLELARIAVQSRPVAEGLDKPVPVEYRAEDVHSWMVDRDVRLELDADHQMRKKDWYQKVYAPQYDRFQQESAKALDRAAREAGLFDKCTDVTSFSNTFYYCSSLTGTIPQGLFDNCSLVTNFQKAFVGTGITSIPEGLFDNCPEVTNFEGAFSNCTGLTSIPEGLFDYNTKVTSFKYTFAGCKGLIAIPEGLFDKCPNVTSFACTFSVCTGLKDKFYNNIFDYNRKVTDFGGTFEFTGFLGESPYTIINIDGSDVKVHLYERENYPEHFTTPTSYKKCFYNCNQITDITEIIAAGWN